MPNVILRVKTNDGIDIIIHHVPSDVYNKYVKEIQSYQYSLIHLRELPYNLTPTKIKEVEAKFNNFLRNLRKKIKGCYEVPHIAYKELDFTTTINS